VSIQIKNLEDSVKPKLFEHLGRRVYLTREGKAVLAFAELLKKQTRKSNLLPLFSSSRKEKSRLVS